MGNTVGASGRFNPICVGLHCDCSSFSNSAMHSRLRSNDDVKRSCANVSGTVIVADVLIGGVALDGVVALRLTTLAQDIVSIIYTLPLIALNGLNHFFFDLIMK